MIAKTYNLEDLAALAAEVLQASSTRLFTLAGEMGAGKTTFVAAFAKVLGSVDAVASPTFPIISQYKTEKGQTIFHIDLYRLKNQQEAIDIGIEDIIYDKNAYIFIEWHEIIADLLPENTAHISLTILNTAERSIVCRF